MTQTTLDSLPKMSIPLMPSRHWDLHAAAKSCEQTQTPLVAVVQTDSGAFYRAVGATDDAGLYYFLPNLARLFHFSIQDAWTIWFFGILTLSFALGVYGMTRFLKSPLVKILYVIGAIGFAALIVKIGDIYLLTPSLAVAVAPFALRFVAEPIAERRFLWRVGLLALLGAAFGLSHTIRSHSATGLIFFISVLLLFSSTLVWSKRFFLVAALVGGFLLPQLYMRTALDARDAFLKERQPTYNAALRQHPFWHTLYIGFGFLNNDYGIVYKDEVAAAKVHAIAPQAEYCSPLYEETLKRAVIDLVKSDAVFVFFTVAAKLGVIGVYFLVAANVGLIAALRYPKPWSVELAFFIALSFNALFGILAMPRLAYLSGFMAFAWLYGVVSLDYAVSKRASEEERKLVGQKE